MKEKATAHSMAGPQCEAAIQICLIVLLIFIYEVTHLTDKCDNEHVKNHWRPTKEACILYIIYHSV